MLKPLYIIPARGGSKGIPHKNIKLFCGRPLIDYAVQAARLAGGQDTNILVSTDDPVIAGTVREVSHLEVPFMRPQHLATDTAGSREVVLHAMDYADSVGIEYDVVVLLQPTSPLRTAHDIAEALNLYVDGVDMVVSVTRAPCNPYYDCFETDANGILHVSKGDGLFTRRQDAPQAWVYNGAVYVINPTSLRAMPLGAFPVRIPYIMPVERSVDLDTPLDWQVAEALCNDKRLFNNKC